MLKLLQFILLLTCTISAENITVKMKTYPHEMDILIDSTPLSVHGPSREVTIPPGKYTITGTVNDSVLLKDNITLYEEDRGNKVSYTIRGVQSRYRFRAAVGGQWIFKNYEPGPIYYESLRKDSVRDTIEATYKKPFSYVTFDLGFVTPRNFYWGIYGELFNLFGMFSFGKEWQFNEKVALYTGVKAGIMGELKNSTQSTYIRNGDTLNSFDEGSEEYIYYGWPVGEVKDSARIVTSLWPENTPLTFGALDAQVSFGERIIKFYLRMSLWFGVETDYTDYELYNFTKNNSQNKYTELGFYRKFAVNPAISSGIQIDITKLSRKETGIHGPYGSRAVTSSGKDIPKSSQLSSKGNRWFGGGIAFGSDSDNYSSSYEYSYYDPNISVFALRTFARFYPKDNFILGPTLEWYRLHYTEFEDFKHQIIPGIDIGYSFNIRNRVMPYLIGSPQIGISIVPNDYDKAYVNWGFVLSGKIGTVIRFTDQLSMYVEPEISLPHESDQLFSIHLGMSFSWGRNSFSLGSSIFPYKELMYFEEFK